MGAGVVPVGGGGGGGGGGIEAEFFMITSRSGGPGYDISDETYAFSPDTSGAVSYEWQAGDTSAVGLYNIEWRVTWGDGFVMTFPSEGFDRVLVNADI